MWMTTWSLAVLLYDDDDKEREKRQGQSPQERLPVAVLLAVLLRLLAEAATGLLGRRSGDESRHQIWLGANGQQQRL